MAEKKVKIEEAKIVEKEIKIQEAEAMTEVRVAAGGSGWTEAQGQYLKESFLTWKEARTQSELPEILRTAFNTRILEGYGEHQTLWPMVFDQIRITKKDVDLPNLKGIHIYQVDDAEEKHFSAPQSGKATMEPAKYVGMVPFSQEMIDDAEIDLMGWTLRILGHRHKQNEDFVSFATFAARGTTMNTNTTTGMNAAALESAMAILANRTVTSGGYTERDPVVADVLLCDPTRLFQAREIIRTSLTVVNNIGGTIAAGGTNVFQNLLNIVATPYTDTDYYYIGKARIWGGALFCRRQDVTVDNWEDMLRDVQNVKAKQRFSADIVEPDKWVRTAYS